MVSSQRLQCVLASALLAFILGADLHAASPPSSTRAAAADLCAKPTDLDTSKWERAQVNYLVMKVPPGYSRTKSVANYAQYTSGRRTITFGLTDGPSSANTGGTMRQLSECKTVIGFRPVIITSYDVKSVKFIVVARWPAIGEMQAASVWYETIERADIEDMRGVFCTMSFTSHVTEEAGAAGATGAAPVPCTAPPPSGPLPPIDAVTDTALVGMFANSLEGKTKGYAVLAFNFDPSGAVSQTVVKASDLPEEGQHRLATLLAPNIKPHQQGWPNPLLLKVDETPTSLHLSVVASECGAAGS